MAFHPSPVARALLAAVLVLPSATALRGQGGAPVATTPARLELRTSSEPAKAMFREALFESANVGGAARIRRAIDSAAKLDPQFTLARLYQAFQTPGTNAERSKAIADLMAGMSAAPMVEILMATYWREVAAGRGAAAVPLLRAVSEIIPGEPDFAWTYTNTLVAGKPVPEQVAIRREFIQKFPTYAAAHNTLAYQLAPTDLDAALAEVKEYVRLAPNHPNAHDSYADILLLQRKPADALPHIQREFELDPEFSQGPMKLGVIHLMMGDAAKARAAFAQGLERYPAPATKREFMYWTAMTYVVTGDGKGAMRELGNILGTTLTPAQTSVVHERMAAVEAFLGDRNAVAGHLTAAGAGTPPAAHFALKAVVAARIGDLDQARAAVTQFVSMVPATNTASHTLNALIALQAKDLATAERELAATPATDLLTKAARADLLLRSGKKAEGTALKQEIVTSTVKQDGNPPVDFTKVMARMYADKL